MIKSNLNKFQQKFIVNTNKNFFKVLRGGVHTTFQDNGFFNKQHFGITVGGVIDYELFILSNRILNNPLNTAVIEFAQHGPKLELNSSSARILISGNVLFNIKKGKKISLGRPFRSYLLKKGDIIDVISTIKSNYGYLSVEGGFKLSKIFGSSSTLTTAKIGANNGNRLSDNQKLYFNNKGSNIKSKIDFYNKIINPIIRVIPGPQMNYFLPKTIKNFFDKPFEITNNSNRIGIRLKKNICKATISNNIPSEGIIKGSIQVPGDGNPIILLNDHPTIGGYPKIAIVILSDLSIISQLPIGTKINFQKISLDKAEKLYKKKNIDFNKKIRDLVF